jgi:hypothetical protein
MCWYCSDPPRVLVGTLHIWLTQTEKDLIVLTHTSLKTLYTYLCIMHAFHDAAFSDEVCTNSFEEKVHVKIHIDFGSAVALYHMQ